jgi:hypothetical protein
MILSHSCFGASFSSVLCNHGRNRHEQITYNTDEIAVSPLLYQSTIPTTTKVKIGNEKNFHTSMSTQALSIRTFFPSVVRPAEHPFSFRPVH